MRKTISSCTGCGGGGGRCARCTQVLATLREAKSLALDHGGNWYSIQFHPEISAEIMRQYWQHENPANIDNYRETPEAPKLLSNFLTLAGLQALLA